MTTGSSGWPRAALVLVCGVFAATQIGKLPPAIPALREAFGASLVQMGWIASIFNLIAACGGLATGLVADRLGRRTLLKAGIAFLGCGALLGLIADGLPMLFISRVIEGFGFVCIVVAAPVLVREAVAPGSQRLALGIWSAYTAAGMTLMLAIAPWSLPALGWQGGWWIGVAGAAVLLLVIWRRFPGAGTRAAVDGKGASLLRGLHVHTPWCLAATFGLYTFQWMAFMVWMPTYLLEQGMSLAEVSGAVALMIVVNAPGNIAGGWLLQRGTPLAMLVLVSTATLSTAGFAVFALMPPAGAVIGLGTLLSFFGGILPGSIYAAVPAVAARHQNLGAVNGLVVQASNIGTLAGPPCAAALASGSGWHGVAPLFVVAGLGCAMLGFAGSRDAGLHKASDCTEK
ncbi:MFS transporter [Ramlibacter sp. PS3R-8]|uniref:MFS transporter n=1 Tax=Ramlibacter sp. PS3R-8 TaxID=3133437 RepID=UPI0030998424